MLKLNRLGFRVEFVAKFFHQGFVTDEIFHFIRVVRQVECFGPLIVARISDQLLRVGADGQHRRRRETSAP